MDLTLLRRQKGNDIPFINWLKKYWMEQDHAVLYARGLTFRMTPPRAVSKYDWSIDTTQCSRIFVIGAFCGRVDFVPLWGYWWRSTPNLLSSLALFTHSCTCTIHLVYHSASVYNTLGIHGESVQSEAARHMHIAATRLLEWRINAHTLADLFNYEPVRHWPNASSEEL